MRQDYRRIWRNLYILQGAGEIGSAVKLQQLPDRQRPPKNPKRIQCPMKQATLVLRLFMALVFLSLSTIASAQENMADAAYQEQWLSTAERAERLIDNSNSSQAALEALRKELVDFRETFLSTRDQNSARIRTLESQIDALGAIPETGDEPEDIAQLRQQLTAQLDTLRVPRIVTEEAFFRANGLISEIDRTLRDRRTAQLLTRGPSPLNPSNWPSALRDVSQFGGAIRTEFQSAWNNSFSRQKFQNNLPVIALLGLVGSLLLLSRRFWSKRFDSLMQRFGGKGRSVWSFLASLVRILLPFLGIIALTQAALLSGLFGFRGTLLLERIPVWGAVLLLFRWLSNQIYSRTKDDQLLPVDTERQTQSCILIDLLAVMLVLNGAIQLLYEVGNTTSASLAVLEFPVIAMTAVILLRFQIVAFRVCDPDLDTPAREAAPEMGRIAPFVLRLNALVAVIAPILAGFGYVTAAAALVFPVVLTFAMITTMLVVHRFVVDVYAWLTQNAGSARDSLASVLMAFALILSALPLLALIWGARPSDLTELWIRFLAGFHAGGIHISPSNFLMFVVIFAVGYTLTRMIKAGLRTILLPKTSIDPGGQNAIVAGAGYIGVFLATLFAITIAGFDLSSLAIVAGALSVGIGFGLQTIVSNFVSGIILLIERPISKGDWIEVGGMMGYVRDISVRSTRIETFDRSDVIVPNSDLISGTVTNFTRGNTVGRVIVPVGVAYGSDVRRVQAILLEIANAHPMVLANPGPIVLFQTFGANALEFEIRAILRDVNWMMSVRSDINFEIAEQFAKAGIETPRPQRDLWLRNPEALHPDAPSDIKPEDETKGRLS